MDHFDLCIVGAGVVGLAIAEYATRHMPSNRSTLILDRNPRIGQETSSRNSEVIHAGIYYDPGSLKARLCVEGRELLYAYCDAHAISHRRVGKLVVAQVGEEEALESIVRAAEANGVNSLQRISGAEAARLEPALSAHEALLSPDTGIIDSHALMLSLLHEACSRGAAFAPFTRLLEAESTNGHIVVTTVSGEIGREEPYLFSCTHLVNAAGLHAQDVAGRIVGVSPMSIPPLFLSRGCYFRYVGKAPFHRLIYPVPEKEHQGLGIHATLDLGGQVKFGPDVEYVEMLDYTVEEARREDFVRAIRRYFPALRAEQLQPDYAGIRPRLRPAGGGTADFHIQNAAGHGVPGLIQLFGIESPGLTASLAIARHVAEMLR